MTLRRAGARARIGRALADAHARRAETLAMLARVCKADVPVLVIVGEDDPIVETLPA